MPRLPLRYVVLFLLLLSACSEPVQVAVPLVTAADVIEANAQLERFSTSLSSDQRRRLANSSTPLTLFAPVNRAFEDLDSRTLSRPVIDYHLLSGRKFLPTDLRVYAGEQLPGSSIRVIEQGANLALQGAGNPNPIAIITVDTSATGSAVYLIDGVLLPETSATPPEPPTEQPPTEQPISNLETALREAGADVFADALTDLSADLTGMTATVFVPADNMLQDALADVTATERRALLERHIIRGNQLRAFDLTGFAAANSPLPAAISGQTWQVGFAMNGVNDGLVLEGYANIIQTDLEVANITLHLLDNVLQDSPPQTGTGVIAGVVFADNNENGVQDGNDAGLEGITVRAFADSNGNGVRDGSEVQHHAVSDARGRYRLTGLDRQLEYHLVQDLPFGWRDSTAVEGVLETQVVGGGDVPVGAYPFMVSLQYAQGDDFTHYCGASLISQRWLLTAAHCAPRTDEVAYLDASQLLPLDNPDAGIRVAFEQVIIHPRFRTERSGFDVALVRLARPINLPTVSLASVNPATTDAYVIGWGDLASGAQVYSDALQDTDVSLLAAVTCWQLYEDNAPLLSDGITNRDTQRCAGRVSGGVDACQGDSGGPLLVRSQQGWLQVGISSWGLGCAFAGLPGVYSNVPALHDWITTNAVETAPVHVVRFVDREGNKNKNENNENNNENNNAAITFDFANVSTLNPYRDEGFTAVRDFMTTPTFPETTTGEVTFTWRVDTGQINTGQVDTGQVNSRGTRCTLDVNDDGDIEQVLEPCSGRQQFTHTYADAGLYRAVLRVHTGNVTHTRRLLVNASQPSEIASGERITGALTTSDSTNFARRQTFSDYFVIETTELSQGMRIVLISDAFEPVLYVLDDQWRTLANSIDDIVNDMLDDNYAEVILASPLPDTLIIAVTSEQAGATGAYDMQVARD